MTTFRQSFGTAFRTIRKSKGLNQDEVAERSGLSTSYISDVERGVANPKLDTVESLAKGIDVKAIELFDFEKRNINPEIIKSKMIESIQNESDENVTDLYHKIMNIFTEIRK